MESKSLYTVHNTANGAKIDVTEVQRVHKLKLYAEFIRQQIGAFSILYEIITGEKPPKLKDIVRR